MGHEGPERSAEVGPGRRPDVVEARPVSAPAAQLATLDALAERAAKAPADAAPSPALRASSVQRLQLRAGNAAVAAMLQRKAAAPVRKPAPALQRKAATAAAAPPARVNGAGAPVTAKADGNGSGALAESAAPTTKAELDAGKTGAAGGPSSGLSFAPGPPPPPAPTQRRAEAPAVTSHGGAAPVVQRSFASMLAEARRRAAAPSGPEDTKSVEGDTDLSDFSDKPALANQERAAIPPPPPPPKPTIPAALNGKVGEKPPPKPPKKRVGKALVAGPKGRPATGGPSAKGAAKPGEIVKKPAPPLPPKWKKPAPGKPVAEIPAPPVEVEKIKPNQDPAFTKVVKAAGMTVKKAKKHPTGKKESESAQGAAVPPGNDIEAQAKAKRADTMATAKPKPFDEEMFVTAVKQELAKTAPKSLSEAGDVEGKAADAKGVIGEKVGASKEAAAGDVEKKAAEPPNPGDATPKPVTPMAPLEIEKPEGMKASGAMPAPVPSEAIDMREGPAKVDNEMGEAGVTEEQLSKSNEPEFTGALDAKKEGEEHSAAAPGEIRKAEGAVLKQAGASAAAVEKQTISETNSTIGDAIGKIGGKKNETKSKDELKRKEVSDRINSIFDKTKSDVDGILTGLDEKVNAEFTTGEAAIRAEFTADWKKRLGAYKSDRYSGLRGPFRWARDKFRGLPAEANLRYEISRRLYEDAMDKLVRRIATIVTQELTRATVRIEQGRGEVSAFVSTLKGDLAKFGQEAAEEVTEKFGNLDSAVKDKFDDMASSLAKKYAESRDAVNSEIEAEKEANKGLIDKAIGAVKGVIRVITQLKDMVLTILAKIADVIGKIIADPIGFLKRFLSAVGDGIMLFAKNIGNHLQKGLMGWLFGALGATGIELPESFSIEGILKLVMSVLGFTWDFIKQRLVKKIGEPAVNALMQGADLVKKVVTGGPSVLWEMIVEKFSDFQAMVIDEIKNFVMEKVVKAGISWILGLLTPAGAFIKACQAIYSIVMFFVERGSEIKEFVESIIDTAGAVARGEGGGIAEKIEGVLARLLPLAISFLANLLGLGGIGEKVRSIIDKVQKPIGKAIDKVLDAVLKITAPVWKGAKKLFNKGKALYGKAKDKAVKAYEKGKDKVKQVGNRVKDVAKSTYAKGKKKVTDLGAAAVDKIKGGLAALKKLLGLPRTKSLKMAGESHTLTADAKGKDVTIIMASRAGSLFDKIALELKIARKEETIKADRDLRVADVRKVASKAKDFRQACLAGMGATSTKKARAQNRDLDTLMNAVRDEIQRYAKDWGVQEFGRGKMAAAGKPKNLGGSEIDGLISEVRLLRKSAFADPKKQQFAADASNIESALAKLRKLAPLQQESGLPMLKKDIAVLRKNIGVQGKVGVSLFYDAKEDGKVGEIAPHGQQGRRGHKRKGKEAVWLQSEHVIPRAWLNEYMVEYHNQAVTDSFYKAMTTIMLYNDASLLKTNTRLPAMKGAKGLAAKPDNPGLPHLRDSLAGAPEAGPSRKDMLENLRAMLDSRVPLTMKAIAVDHKNNLAERQRLKAPLDQLPTRDRVVHAAEQQLSQVDKYISENRGAGRKGFNPQPITKNVKMDSGQHKLVFIPPAKLELHSEAGILVQKLQQSIAALSQGTPKPELQIHELGQILKLAEQIDQVGPAAAAAAQAEEDLEKVPDAVKKLQQLLAALANGLDAYGAKYHKKDLPKDAPKEGDSVGIPYDEGKTAETLKETELYKKFGMPAKNAHQAVKVAAQFEVQILVRPTNPTAPVLLERGLLPKPESIKAKTINADDVKLGAHVGISEDDIGKVGFFEPKLPEQGPMSEDAYRKLYTRFVQRQKEHVDDYRKIMKKIKEKTLELKNGKLVDKATQKEFTGDHDLYAVLDSGGRPLVDVAPDTAALQKKEAVVAALKGGTFNAQHGAHLDWKPKTPEEQHIFNVIVKAHQAGEPLLKITGSGCSVTYHKPLYMADEG